MAAEEDEDTVMGEAVTHNPNPTPSQHLTHDGASHSNGRSDPWFNTPLLGPPLKLPVQPAASVRNPQPAAAADNHTMSPPKSLPKSADSGDATTEVLVQLNDSLVEENSDWSEGEDAVAIRGLPIAQLPSGLCYDVQMRYHCEVRPTADVHPEDPRRIYYIYKELCRAGLVDDPESSRPLVSRPMKRISVRNATEEEISLVHTPDHFAFVESTKDMTDDELIALEHTRDSIYFNKLTFASSLLSVGGAIETCLAVATRKVKNAIAVIRPPGHHAEHDKTMGFCLFNNVSVAARVCQKQLGDKCRKILILDWDVHHGKTSTNNVSMVQETDAYTI